MDWKHQMKEPGIDVVETAASKAVGDTDEESILEYLSYRNQRVKLESARWTGYSEHQPALQILDLLQESTTILRKYNGILLLLGLCLAVPLSVILLSHVLLQLPFMDHWVRAVQLAAEQRFKQHSHRAGYRRLAEIIMSNMVDIPFSALFSPLLKAGVAYVVASSYARKRLELEEVVDVLQKLWLLLMLTFMWTCLVYLTFATAFASLLWLASHSGSLFGTTIFIIATMVGLVLAAGLAYASVMCNLAYVVTALEGFHGWPALAQSIHLLKGRFEVALLLFLIINVNGTLLDILFEFHIIRNSNPAAVHDKYWEAPLLICMHSFVYLFDAIMVSVLYYLCKATEVEIYSISRASVENQASAS